MRKAMLIGGIAAGDAIAQRVRSSDTITTRDERAEIGRLLAGIASPADKFAALQRADAIRRQQALVNIGVATVQDGMAVNGLARIRLGLMQREDEQANAAMPKPMPDDDYLKTRADRLARGRRSEKMNE